MGPNLDSLINQLVSIKPLDNPRLASLQPAIIAAVVLKSSPLLQTPGAQAPAGTSPQASTGPYSITLDSAGKQYEISSKLPLPLGTRLQLKITQDNVAVLLRVLGQAPPQETRPPTANSSPLTAQQQLIDQSVRQALPQQQPLNQLARMLQQLNNSGSQQLPSSVRNNIALMLALMPSPDKLQQAQDLKQAMNNSGLFLESKLAQLQANAGSAATAISPHPPALHLQGDIKAQLQQLLQLVQRASTGTTSNTSQTQAAAHSKSPGTATAQPQTTSSDLPTSKSGEKSGEAISTSLAKEGSALLTTSSAKVSTAAPTPATGNSAEANTTIANPVASQPGAPPTGSPGAIAATHPKEQNLDIVLRQLGRQIIASLARTELNQLESLISRTRFAPDGQGSNNSWVLEIPIMHGKHADNLQLRIDEETADDSAEGSAESQSQWIAMLAFDLHALGKMSVQLKVTETQLNATVWSQLKQTHQQVQQQLSDLQRNLESVGVSVNKVECLLGLPPKGPMQLQRQLVDLHT
ncbi:MAG: hypothetical protein GY813_02355 [Halieaceae bacterium]|nr:hypothetical protein [Halieaceae bacterium]